MLISAKHNLWKNSSYGKELAANVSSCSPNIVSIDRTKRLSDMFLLDLENHLGASLRIARVTLLVSKS